MEIIEIPASASTKKQQHPIIEDLLAFCFNDALEKSTVNNLEHENNQEMNLHFFLILKFKQLIEKKPTQDHTFKVGAKVLNTIVSNLKKKDNVNSAYEVITNHKHF